MRSVFITIFLLLLNQVNAFSQFYQAAETVSSKKLIQAYFVRAMQYPSQSLTDNTEGKVKVIFRVQPDGKCTDFRIERGINEALNIEAARLAKKILWRPATENGRPVSSNESIEIVFNKKQYLRQKKSENQLQHDFQGTTIDTSGVIFNFAQLETQPSPHFDMNYRNLNHYINGNLKYPETAMIGGIQGNVKLGFVVEEDGLCSNIYIIESVGGGCDQEAIRILETLNWNPGLIDGKRVRSHFSLDVNFRLNENIQHQIPNRQSGGL